MKYETRITQLTVAPEGDPIFSELATTVTIVDEAAGEFVSVAQGGRVNEVGHMAIEPAEWPALMFAIEEMVGKCRKTLDKPE